VHFFVFVQQIGFRLLNVFVFKKNILIKERKRKVRVVSENYWLPKIKFGSPSEFSK